MNFVPCHKDEDNLKALSCARSTKKNIGFHELPLNVINDRMRNGDRRVFEYLYVTYNKNLVKWLKNKTLNQGLSEDLVHDMFLSLWSSRNKFNVRTSIGSYLYSIANNRLMDYYKGEKKHYKLIQNLTQKNTAIFYDINEPDGHNDHLESIKKEVDELPKKCKEMVIMSKYYGYKYSEIAKELKIPVKTVESTISRAFSIIRQKKDNNDGLSYRTQGKCLKKA